MKGSTTSCVLFLYITAIIGGLVFSAYSTYRDYFLRWGSNSELYANYDVGVKAIGQYIAALPREETIYLSPTWGEHSSLRLHSNERDDIRAYNGRHCFVFPRQTDTLTTFIIVARDEKNSLLLLPNYFPQGQTSYEGILDNGEHYFTAYQIPVNSQAHFMPQVPLEANWDNQIKLLGYDFEVKEYVPGNTITLNLYYQASTDMPHNYSVFIHLWGEPDSESGNIIYGQRDREPCFQSYPTSHWQPGEVIRDTFTFSIAPDATAGTYLLATGFYKWPELSRLPLVESDYASESNAVILGEVLVGTDPQ